MIYLFSFGLPVILLQLFRTGIRCLTFKENSDVAVCFLHVGHLEGQVSQVVHRRTLLRKINNNNFTNRHEV